MSGSGGGPNLGELANDPNIRQMYVLNGLGAFTMAKARHRLSSSRSSVLKTE